MTALALVAVLVLVLLNGFFVAAEFALVRVRTSRIEELAEAGAPRARADARRLLDDMSRYLAACQVGITLTSLGIGFLGEPAIGHLFEEAFGEDAPGWCRRRLLRARLPDHHVAAHHHRRADPEDLLDREGRLGGAAHRAAAVALHQALPARSSPRSTACRTARCARSASTRGGEFEEGGSPDELKSIIAQSMIGGHLDPGRGGDALRRLPPARAAGAPGHDAGARARHGRRRPRTSRPRCAAASPPATRAWSSPRTTTRTASPASCTPTSSRSC